MKDVFITRDQRGSFSDSVFAWMTEPPHENGVFGGGANSPQPVTRLVGLDNIKPGHMLRLTVAETIDCRPPEPIQWVRTGCIDAASLGWSSAFIRPQDSCYFHCETNDGTRETGSRSNFTTREEARAWCEAELRKAAGR